MTLGATNTSMTAAQCRRLSRFLIRFHDIDTSPGMCMHASKALAKLLGGKAIQGNVVHKTGIMSHWWVEWNGFLIDPTCKQMCFELEPFCAPALGVWPLNSSNIANNLFEYLR